MPTPEESRVLREMARTWCPRDSTIPVDALDAGVDAALDRFVDALDGPRRLAVRALLRTVEQGYGLAHGRPGVRFTDALPDDRKAWLARLGRGAQAAPLEWLRIAAVRAWLRSQPVAHHLPLSPRGDR